VSSLLLKILLKLGHAPLYLTFSFARRLIIEYMQFETVRAAPDPHADFRVFTAAMHYFAMPVKPFGVPRGFDCEVDLARKTFEVLFAKVAELTHKTLAALFPGKPAVFLAVCQRLDHRLFLCLYALSIALDLMGVKPY
jgi:hypothetical protein